MNKESLKTFIVNNFPPALEKIDEIISFFEERVLKKDELFLQLGKVSNEYLFLEAGFLRVFTFDHNGDEVTTDFHSKNKVVFEPASFFTRTASEENFQALTDCKGYSITCEKFNILFHAMPEFREFGRLMLTKGFVAFKQRTLGLINKSAEQRYAELMIKNKEIFQFAQLKHIASYLGVTDTSLSRIRKEFAKKQQVLLSCHLASAFALPLLSFV
jgi:CRP-like cAMP-binding protein